MKVCRPVTEVPTLSRLIQVTDSVLDVGEQDETHREPCVDLGQERMIPLREETINHDTGRNLVLKCRLKWSLVQIWSVIKYRMIVLGVYRVGKFSKNIDSRGLYILYLI